jgi:hypothetical protein
MMLVSIITLLWAGQSKNQCLVSDVETAVGVWYQSLTHIWYQRLENNRAVPPQKSHGGYSATTFPVLPL